MSEELTEKEATMDHETILEYIQVYLIESPLATYLDDVTREDYARDWDHAEDGVSRLDMLDKQLRRQEAGLSYMKALPKLDFLVSYLTKKADAMFMDIAKAEKRSVRFDQPTELAVGSPIRTFDLRVCGRTQKGVSCWRDNLSLNIYTWLGVINRCETRLTMGRMIQMSSPIRPWLLRTIPPSVSALTHPRRHWGSCLLLLTIWIVFSIYI
jgi:hypothetical protein